MMNLLLYFALWNILHIPFGFVNIHTKTSSHTTMTRKIFLEKKADTTLVNHKQIPLNKKLAKKRKHSMRKALILALPIVNLPIGGMIGLHRFYLGYKKTGWIMFALSFLSIWAFWLAILSGTDTIIGAGLINFFFLSILYIISIWAIIDFVLISTGILKFKDGTPLEW